MRLVRVRVIDRNRLPLYLDSSVECWMLAIASNRLHIGNCALDLILQK